MGSVRLGPPTDLVLALRAACGASAFLESGTYRGQTTEWAAQHFERVVTIEAYEKRFSGALRRLGPLYPNVLFVRGDSRFLLRDMLRHLPEPAILWLDAHWCGEGAHDAHLTGDECPLREEIDSCNALGRSDIILIDDLRLFVAPPPYPHDPAQWPTLDEVFALLGDRHVVTAEDVIAAVPRDLEPAVVLVDRWAAGRLSDDRG